MTALTEYQRAVEEYIRAAGHETEWRKPNFGMAEVLHIDGVASASLTGSKPEAPRVYCYPHGSLWRTRKLPPDPKKAAAMLLDRHKVALKAKAMEKARDEQEAAERDRIDALDEALAGVAAVHQLCGNGATLRFESLTVEQAAKIAAALGQ